MADRLSQLQDAVNQQAENLCNAIGILFQNAPPAPFPNFDKNSKTPSQTEGVYDHKKMFATLIARNAKDIDVLIDSLPSEESCAELQVSTNSMRELEACGEEAANRLLRDVERGEALLGEISRALADIANVNLSINRVTDAAQAQHIKI
ncbi:Mediator complex subunit Med21 [Trinorchestia longiramus]|nr:Mediator complex subunit Med21 [Trinorchestia longiramus]